MQVRCEQCGLLIADCCIEACPYCYALQNTMPGNHIEDDNIQPPDSMDILLWFMLSAVLFILGWRFLIAAQFLANVILSFYPTHLYELPSYFISDLPRFCLLVYPCMLVLSLIVLGFLLWRDIRSKKSGKRIYFTDF